ncbi:TetR family transcriptional regulator [[Phormidium ambiguum] IAM M-71]|uniref:TetR family transcriptional regulator n=1 Tax=[Phormidium ambiguum] IAM M-71 TaxID=454136 RepID=A0A1U7IIU5_9CYAN|nr:TetR/AcrR family transcriptional regulator [Phormidium ambiguum]OKH37112.1 TetR family transcriptional regulator [Phormidium ambiguum IAM M-71]
MIEKKATLAINNKQEQILQGAMRIFLHHGYATTSMDRVAAEAGVSKQTIYSHFQDKERLFKALIERVTIRRLQAEYQSESELFQGEPVAVLSKLANSILRRMEDPEYIAFIRLVIAESGRFPELAQLYSNTVVQYGYRNLTAYFQSHPELNIPDSEASTRIFMGTIVGFILSQELLQGKHTMPMEKERLIKSLIRCILGDIATKEISD